MHRSEEVDHRRRGKKWRSREESGELKTERETRWLRCQRLVEVSRSGTADAGYPVGMTKLNFTSLLVAGAVASFIGAAPIAAASTTPIATSPQTVSTASIHFLPTDDNGGGPGGGGCVNGQCGSGGVNAGPGGSPGGGGCIPGVGCGSGHG